MKNRKLEILAVLTIVVLGVGSYRLWGGAQESGERPETVSTTDEPEEAGPAVEADDPNGATAHVQRNEMPPAEEGLPTTQAAPAAPDASQPYAQEEYYDEDLAEDDGDESMVNFAQELSGLMERAMESEREALPAFAELERCASDPESSQGVQAQLICFANASRLSKEYPGLLGNRFVSLAKQNPKLVGMLETTGME